MNSTDELTCTLRCAEFMADSPSTSSSTISRSEPRRRSHRVVLQPLAIHNNTRRTSLPAQCGPTRKRLSADRLNTSQHPSVRVGHDRVLHLDGRVLRNLMTAEESLMPNPHYFTSVQVEVCDTHREQAVEWITDVSKEENCDCDVLPLAVSLIDRFLSVQNIFKHDVQTLAGVCLFIASKVKAPQPMNAQKIAYYTDDSVRSSDILSWELLVLSHLGWDINSPTAFDFFDQISGRIPSLAALRIPFADIVHKILRCHKLATLYPSLQCSLALVFAAVRQNDQTLKQDLEREILRLFNLSVDLILSYLPLLERIVIDGPSVEAHTPRTPPSSVEMMPASPSLNCSDHSIPATPHNDSGFCSGISSPESAGKKDMDCSPPKMARLSV